MSLASAIDALKRKQSTLRQIQNNIDEEDEILGKTKTISTITFLL
jgi:hypothetical protein